MLPPLIRRPRSEPKPRSGEGGFTMALVALALTAIIAMAALSIDIGTLYQAKAEAQRAADAAALTAARMISLSGITGDPTNTTSSWQTICGGANPPSTLAATKMAQQNLISGVSVPSASVTVTYGAGSAGGAVADCSIAGTAFGVNPTVTVTVKSAKLPIFFARVFSLLPGVNYSGTTVSASATAEAFNPSNSGSSMIPVQPRCVKPWIIPNHDPIHATTFVGTDGTITTPGVLPIGTYVIGESFSLNADCKVGAADCLPANSNMINNPPQWTGTFLEYIPTLIPVTDAIGAIPSCSPTTTGFQAAIAGCDQTDHYKCGTPNFAQYDLNENPVNPTGATGDTGTAVLCLTHAATGGGDTLAPVYPFQIGAGFDNPLVPPGLVKDGDIITASNSIVTIPIYDNSTPGPLTPQVTIIGFLQVFINVVNANGNVNVTVMNVAGCSNAAAGNPTVTGTSPMPVRLITPP